MADPTYDFIKIQGYYSKANFTVTKPATIYVLGTRFIEDYPTELPIKTERKFNTLVNPNSNEFVILQSKKIRTFIVELRYKETQNRNILKECEKIVLRRRDGLSIDVELIEQSSENAGDTQMKTGTFTFSEILQDEFSLTSHAESDNVLEKVGVEAYAESIYLQLNSNKNIDSVVDFAGGENLKFYTLFYPEFDRIPLMEDKTMTKTLTGQIYTLQTYNCRAVKLKLFLNDENLNTLRKYIKSCFYETAGVYIGVKIMVGAVEYQCEQTVNDDDIEIAENDSLIDLTEINITIKRDFIRNDIYDV